MRALSIVVLALTLAACAKPSPVAVREGEGCWRCRRPIEQVRLAGEFVADNGLASKFRTIHCMSTWIGQQAAAPRGSFYVTDYSSGKWVPADQATYVRVVVNRNTMEQDFIAFELEGAAAKTAYQEKAVIQRWDDVLQLGRQSPLGGN